MQLENTIIGITGAGSGIGKAIALRLAAVGGTLAVTDIDLSKATQVCDEIGVKGGKAKAWQMDVTKQSNVPEVVGQIIAEYHRLDIWVNNAGVSSMNTFLELTEKDWDFNMDVNAKGQFLCSQAVVKYLIQNELDPVRNIRGKVINVASMAGKRGNAPFLAHYVASKFAVVGLTQAMAGELAPYQITVNSVCPGYVRTDMQSREVGWEASLRKKTPEEVRELYINDTPLGRLEEAGDIASVVEFLASPLSDFITGEAININGGAWMD
jgi:meso-butanediol dehydrogenase / (S,S)-butanediol dehydrogenase / diacetyl reductase